MSFGARARIRLGALRDNLRRIRRQAPGAQVMAVVKANAYGHGLLPVATALGEADALAVARLTEAEKLRGAGIDQPIVLLPGVLAQEDLGVAAELGVEIGVHAPTQIDWLEKSAARDFVAWFKVDTGMRRLGFRSEEAGGQLSRLQQCTSIAEVRLLTHLACADDPHNDFTRQQLDAFNAVIREFDGDVSVGNTPGLFGWADEIAAVFAQNRNVWIRPGLGLYGISPFTHGCGADLDLRPVMQFEARLISVKPVRRGDRVGYGGTWVAERDTMLGIVGAGYGDGYSRFIPSGTPVLVNDRRVPVAGVVSMDMTAVDLGPDAKERVGDLAVLWGDELPVEEIARHAGTIPYQLVCGVTHREEPEIVD